MKGKTRLRGDILVIWKMISQKQRQREREEERKPRELDANEKFSL